MPFLQSRQLVRSQPYRTPITYIQTAVANGAVLDASFDVTLVLADRNQLATGPSLLGLPSSGPFLDAAVISTQIGTLDVFIQLDAGSTAFTMLAAPLAVAALVPLIISGLRIPARFVTAEFRNTSGVAATVDFTTLVGSA